MVLGFYFARDIDVDLAHDDVLCQNLWLGYCDVIAKLSKFIVINPMLLYLHLSCAVSHFEFRVGG
jgi:hypothetical protein